MKYYKFPLVFFLFFAFTIFGNAQTISPNAIGLRIGDGDGFGAEISYQRLLGESNRLEVDLGLRNGKNYDGYKLTGIYQWVWNIEGNFNWFAGVGGGFGNYSYDDDFPGNGNNDDFSESFLFAAGQLGIEYNFNIPLMISIDTRPGFGFGDENDDLDLDLALGIRYQF